MKFLGLVLMAVGWTMMMCGVMQLGKARQEIALTSTTITPLPFYAWSTDPQSGEKCVWPTYLEQSPPIWCRSAI